MRPVICLFISSGQGLYMLSLIHIYTIKSILKDWGLKEDTNYKINNLEGTLTFWNDSGILHRVPGQQGVWRLDLQAV